MELAASGKVAGGVIAFGTLLRAALAAAVAGVFAWELLSAISGSATKHPRRLTYIQNRNPIRP